MNNLDTKITSKKRKYIKNQFNQFLPSIVHCLPELENRTENVAKIKGYLQTPSPTRLCRPQKQKPLAASNKIQYPLKEHRLEELSKEYKITFLHN